MNLKRIGKKYRYIDHLSDIGIEFYGNKLEELFENAGVGMFSIMCDLELVKPQEKRNIKISQKDTCYEDLLVLWLERLLYLYEVDYVLFSEFKVGGIHKKGRNLVLTAEISGEKIDLNKHKIKIAIKAPTYHMLEIKRDDRYCNWKGRIIFDV